MHTKLSRRRFLEATLFAGASATVAARLAFANAPTNARFVFVLLRGALDGLSAVPPVGDSDYAALRGQIAIAKSGADAALPLILATPVRQPPAAAPGRRATGARRTAVRTRG